MPFVPDKPVARSRFVADQPAAASSPAAVAAPAIPQTPPPGGWAQPYAAFTPEAQRLQGYTGEGLQPVTGAGEAALQAGTGLASSIGGGVAGLLNFGFNHSPIGYVAHKLGVPEINSADLIEKIQQAGTYRPRTFAGQVASQAVSDAFDPSVGTSWLNPLALPGNIGTKAGDISADLGAPAAVSTALRVAPEVFTPLAVNKAGEAIRASQPAARPAPVVPPRQALANELVDKGIKLTPTQVGNTAGGVAEGLTGHAKLERSLSLKNAPVVNKLVGEDVGLKNAKNITEGDLNRLKIEANKPYREISQTGVRQTSDDYRNEIANIGDRTGGNSFAGDVPPDVAKLKDYYGGIKQFDAKDAVNKIRQLRSEASKNIKAINAPEQNAKGQVQRSIADALDNELARHVESIGRPELAAQYKAARVQLAKIHTLEDALEGSNVSAKALAQAADRGAPLSGNMALIARGHKEFDRAFQDVGKIRDSSPFGIIDLGAGVVGATANPWLAAAVAARPLTRAALASDFYQRRFVGGGSPAAANVSPVAVPVAAPNTLGTGASVIGVPNALSAERRRR